MRSQGLNNSSKSTKKLIKKVFAEMLSEKQELCKISVTELCKRCNISRGSFYSHYEDIYCVAEDYEEELTSKFFSNGTTVSVNNFEEYVDLFFNFIKENDSNYKLLCRSNEFLFAAKKLTTLASKKFLEICLHSTRLINKDYLKMEINIFVNGLVCEYIKYCRDCSNNNIDDLHNYTLQWLKEFQQKRFR